jgi:prolyl 4-hydroxylase
MRYEIIENFLSKQECDQLIASAKDKLVASTTLDPVSGAYETNSFRQSDQMYFRLGETPLVADIEKRISDKVGVPVENGEGLQVVKYSPGGYFRAHRDAFDPNFPGNQAALKYGGQRKITFLMYLNDVEGGGDTYFNKFDMSVKPIRGRAIVWWNIHDDGTRDEDTLHEGRPVPEGQVKFIATKWLRERRFT